jgi:hypothetical protein
MPSFHWSKPVSERQLFMPISRNWQPNFSFSLNYESVEARFASRLKEKVIPSLATWPRDPAWIRLQDLQSPPGSSPAFILVEHLHSIGFVEQPQRMPESLSL